VPRSNFLQLKACLLKKALVFSAFFYVLLFSAGEAAGSKVCPPQHINESARVNYVYDGDTLQLEDGRKIRLLGIDTPEIFSKRRSIAKETKRRGERAKSALQQLLNSSNQQIGLSFGAQRFDRYQRTLAHLFLPDGTNLQAQLISQGYAIAFTTPPNDRMSDCYQQQEAIAIKQKLGIWRLPQYQLKQTSQLTNNSNGFHRLRAKVTHIWKSANRLTLLLDGRVEVKIHNRDFANFNAHMLNTLENKQVEMRGWLRLKKSLKNENNKTQYIMTLRHPDAIKVLN